MANLLVPNADVQPHHRRVRRDYSYILLFGLALFYAGFGAFYWIFLVRHASSGIYWDQWNQVSLAEVKFWSWKFVTYAWLQHNENRMFVPNLIDVALLKIDKLNSVPIVFLGAILNTVWVTVLLGLVVRRPLSGVKVVAGIVIVAFGFSLMFWEDSLWAFQTAWFLISDCLAITAWAAYFSPKPKVAIIGFCVVLAGTSSLQGLLVGIVAVFGLLWRKSWHNAAIVSLIFILTVILYVTNFNFSNTGGASNSLLEFFMSHLSQVALFWLTDLASGVGLVSTKVSLNLVEAAGFVVLMIALVVLAVGLKAGYKAKSLRSIGIAYILFGLGFTVLVALGRSNFGIADGLSSRYTLYTICIPVGVVLVGADLVSGRSTAIRLGFSALALIFLVGGCIGDYYSYQPGVGLFVTEEHSNAVVASWDSNGAKYYSDYAYPAPLNGWIGYMRVNHLGVFDSPHYWYYAIEGPQHVGPYAFPKIAGFDLGRITRRERNAIQSALSALDVVRFGGYKRVSTRQACQIVSEAFDPTARQIGEIPGLRLLVGIKAPLRELERQLDCSNSGVAK